MFLAIDAGNTSLKLGLYDSQNNLSGFRIISYDNIAAGWPEKSAIRSAALSSVVPEKTDTIREILIARYGISPYLVSSNCKFDLKIQYNSPETLGIDRLCSCEGALSLLKDEISFKKENICIITIDMGTASTINIVKVSNIDNAMECVFSGGIILPGISTMFNSLSSNTSQLPLISHSDYSGLIGRDTRSSIASGVINSTISLIEKVLNSLTNEYTEDRIKLFVTGGNAAIRDLFPFRHIFVKDLVLRGVKAVCELNSENQP